MRHSKSSLFLMELIVAILFFSLASAVCIQMFVKAHLLSSRTVDANHAVIHAQNLAECWYHTEGDYERMVQLMGQGSLLEDGCGIALFFDQEWNACDGAAAVYQVQISDTAGDARTISAQITVTKRSSDTADAELLPVYELSLVHHPAGTLANLAAAGKEAAE